MASILRDKDKVQKAVLECFSIRSTLKKLNLAPAGGNYECIKKAFKDFDIDTSHFTGQGHLKGKNHTWNTRPLQEVLVHEKLENTYKLKNRLLKEGIKKHICEKCYLTMWLGNIIPLELHHVDGDRTNNLLENIQFLCPNCHALTDNYRGKNKKTNRHDTDGEINTTDTAE